MKLFMRIFLMAVLSSAVGYVTVVNAAEEWRGEDGLSWGADISDYGVVITRIPVQTKGTVAIPASLRVPTGAENSEEGFEEDDVVELDEAALDGCRYVTEFSVGTDNDYFRAVDGVLYDADVSVLIRCPPGKAGRLEIPDTVFEIAESAFFECSGITEVILPKGLVKIGSRAFLGCRRLPQMTIPPRVTVMGGAAFGGCMSLTNVTFEGDAPLVEIERIMTFHSQDHYGRRLYWEETLDDWGNIVMRMTTTDTGIPVFDEQVVMEESRCGYSNGIYATELGNRGSDYQLSSMSETSSWLVSRVHRGSRGWNRFEAVESGMGYYSTNAYYGSREPVSYLVATNLPMSWCGRSICYSDGVAQDQREEGPASTHAYLTVTNVVVNYVLNSVQPKIAVPVTESSGLVNVITEVKSGGVVAIPPSWAENYSDFAEKFGTDFTKALMKETGKHDAAGNPMYVWQDYVVGTDPTDINDVFIASITMVEGSPVISWSPELPAELAQQRSYVVRGKVKLQDTEWVVIPTGHEADYNFFKVTVEMK